MAAPTARLDELGGDELGPRVVRAGERIAARLEPLSGEEATARVRGGSQ
jgi:hypothetical protein